jgi:hypothetical protein
MCLRRQNSVWANKRAALPVIPFSKPQHGKDRLRLEKLKKSFRHSGTKPAISFETAGRAPKGTCAAAMDENLTIFIHSPAMPGFKVKAAAVPWPFFLKDIF